MTITCDYCGKVIEKKKSNYDKSKHHFCDIQCASKYRTKQEKQERILVKCENCGADVYVAQYKYKLLQEGKQKHIFCSKLCHSEWEHKQPSITVELMCQYCGKKFHVLPKDANRKYCSMECSSNDRLQKIETTCANCGKTIYRKKSTLRTYNFCSLKCSQEYGSTREKTSITLKCQYCGKEFVVAKHREHIAKFCSYDCYNRWQKEVYAKTPIARRRYQENMLKQRKCDTKPEAMVREYLEKKQVNYIAQYFIGPYVVDFYLPDTNTIIEVWGDFWHGNPLLYGDQEGQKPFRTVQLKNMNRDKIKLKYFPPLFDYHTVWEHDIYKNIEDALCFLDIG